LSDHANPAVRAERRLYLEFEIETITRLLAALDGTRDALDRTRTIERERLGESGHRACRHFEDRAGFVRPDDFARSVIVRPAAEMRGLARKTQQRFALPELIGGTPPLVDIFDDPDELIGSADVVDEQRQREAAPDGRAILMDVALLQRRCGQGSGDHLRGQIFFDRAVIGVGERDAGLVQQLLRGIADDHAQTTVRLNVGAVEGDEAHADRRVIEEHAKTQLTIVQRFCGPVLRRHIREAQVLHNVIVAKPTARQETLRITSDETFTTARAFLQYGLY